MKKGNIITILIVIFIVLLGVLYIKNENKKIADKEIPFGPGHPLYDPTFEQENIDKGNPLNLPRIPQAPFTQEECQNFIDKYHCQEGTTTSEGLVDCHPDYFRTKIRCQAFLEGREDPYGNNYDIPDENTHSLEDKNEVNNKIVEIFDKEITLPPYWKVKEEREGIPGEESWVVKYILIPGGISQNKEDNIFIAKKTYKNFNPGEGFAHKTILLFHFPSGLEDPIPMYTNSSKESVLNIYEDIKKQLGVKKIPTPLVCRNKVGKTMSYDTALDIAQNSQTCMSAGKIKEDISYRCGAFPDFIAIPLDVKDKPGCNPHCLVNIDTHETEVNWMCTGAI